MTSQVAYRMIVAFVRPNRRMQVAEALRKVGAVGFTFTEVTGAGEAAGGRVGVPHVRFDVVARADQVESFSQAIGETASTGEPGDGLVAVMPVYGAFRIRNFQPL
jgi:nitrogen regulatory protein PII